MAHRPKARPIKRPRYFLSLDACKEEMELFMQEWRIEKEEYGVFVPPHRLYNTTAVLKELVDRGYLCCDENGYVAPS